MCTFTLWVWLNPWLRQITRNTTIRSSQIGHFSFKIHRHFYSSSSFAWDDAPMTIGKHCAMFVHPAKESPDRCAHRMPAISEYNLLSSSAGSNLRHYGLHKRTIGDQVQIIHNNNNDSIQKKTRVVCASEMIQSAFENNKTNKSNMQRWSKMWRRHSTNWRVARICSTIARTRTRSEKKCE